MPAKLKFSPDPKQRIRIKKIEKNKWIYSHNKKNNKALPPNSTWWPATNSDSASLWSKGALLASNKIYKKNIEASGGIEQESQEIPWASLVSSKE